MNFAQFIRPRSPTGERHQIRLLTARDTAVIIGIRSHSTGDGLGLTASVAPWPGAYQCRRPAVFLRSARVLHRRRTAGSIVRLVLPATLTRWQYGFIAARRVFHNLRQGLQSLDFAATHFVFVFHACQCGVEFLSCPKILLRESRN